MVLKKDVVVIGAGAAGMMCAVQGNQWDLDVLRALVEKIMITHVEDLYLIHMSIFEGVGVQS